VDDTLILDAVRVLLECARAGVAETSNQAPGRTYVSMGTPAHDDCCDGQLVAWWTRIYPSGAFPDPDVRNALCGWGMVAVDVSIEIVRCSPASGINGAPPSVDALEEVARVTNIDARAVWKAVLCCLQERIRAPYRWSAVVRDQVAVDPSGGCVGSRMNVTIGLIDGCECT